MGDPDHTRPAAAELEQLLELAQAVTAATTTAASPAEALISATDEVADRSSYMTVTATLLDHEAGIQVIVADRGHEGAAPEVGIRRPLDAGLVGYVAGSGEQLLLGHAASDPRYAWHGGIRYESLLLTPVALDGRCEAVLELCDTRPDRFGDADIALMRIVAGQLAATLRGVRSRVDSERRAARLELAAAVAAAIAPATTVTQALELASIAIHEKAGYERVSASLVLPDSGEQLEMVDIGHGATSEPVRRPIDDGLTGEAIRTHQQFTVGSVRADHRYAWPVELEIESLLVTPIVVDDTCVAAIDVADRRIDAYDREDAALMAVVAEHLAAAWRSVRLRDQAERRARRLAIASEVSKLSTAPGSIEDMLRETARVVFEQTGYDAVTITLADERAGEQVVIARHTADGEAVGEVRRPIATGLAGRTIRTGVQILTGRVDLDPAADGGQDEPYLSAIVTPVMVDGRCFATVDVWELQPHRFDTWDAVAMETVTEQLAIAIRARDLRGQSDRRAQRLALSLDVARAVAGEQTISGTLQATVDTLFVSIGCTTVCAVRADRGEQVLLAARSSLGERPVGLRRPVGEGMTGRVMETGQAVRAGDQPPESMLSRWPGEHHHAAGMIVPVLVDGVAAATLELYDAAADRFDAQDEVLVRAIAEQVAAAIRGAELREASERRANRLGLTAEVARAVVGSQSIDEALEIAARTIYQGTEHEAVSVIRVDHERAELVMTLSFDRSGPSSAVGMRWPASEGIAARVLTDPRPLRLGRAVDDPDYRWAGPEHYPSLVYVPVVVDGRCEAAFELASQQVDAFNEDDEALLVTVAEQVGAALRGARLRDESEERAARLAMASEVARQIAAAESADEAVRTAVGLIHERSGYALTAAARISPDRTEQIFVSALDRAGPSVEGLRRPVTEGLTGVVVATGEQVSVGNASRSEVASWPGDRGLESVMITPVLIDGLCVATLHLGDEHPDCFDETDASLMRAVAEQVAASLRGIQLRTESEQRAGRLAVALDVARAVAGERTVDSTLRSAMRAIAGSVAAHAFSAYVPLPASGEQLCAVDIDPTGSVEGEVRSLDDTTSGAVLTGAGQINISDARRQRDYTAWRREASGFRSVLLTPVVVDGEPAAAIGLYSLEPRRFNDDDTLLMRTIAEQVAGALRGARLRDESERRAKRLAVSLDVARRVAGTAALEDALRAAVETIAEAIPCGAVGGFLATGSEEMVCVVDIDRHGSSVEGMRRPIGTGHIGAVFQSGRQLHMRTAGDSDQGEAWSPDDWVYESAVFTPVLVDGRALAVIALTDTAPGRFHDDDALLMRTVAEQLAAALRGARLRDESERRARRLALTLEVAKAVATAATPAETLRSAVEAIAARIDCGSVAAFVADCQAGVQRSVIDLDHHGNSTEGMTRPIGEGTTGAVFATGEQLIVGDNATHERFVPWHEGGWVYTSVLITPVVVDGRCDAVLGLYDTAVNRFDEDDGLLMSTIAEQVAAALRGARLRDESESRAQRLEALEQRQRSLLERLVRAQEQERTQVAGDLHDDTVQVLSACVIALDRVRRAIEAGALDRATAALRDAAGLISGAVERTRRMTFELRPAVLWQHGLEPAVRHLLEALSQETGMATGLAADRLPERLDPTVEAIAFRSISELITNVRTHAEAQRVDVELEVEGDRLRAEVRDDGRGFELGQAMERARATNHLGIEALTERIDAAGGSVEFETAPGKGTTVTIALPVRAASSAA